MGVTQVTQMRSVNNEWVLGPRLESYGNVA